MTRERARESQVQGVARGRGTKRISCHQLLSHRVIESLFQEGTRGKRETSEGTRSRRFSVSKNGERKCERTANKHLTPTRVSYRM